jgi:acid stress-induced BolA-like protein IbaG/YrbA
MRTLARHQKVYAVLGERMKEEIHALSFKTLTPEEFKNT